jgi:hypothetical protein
LSAPLRDRKPLKYIKMIPQGNATAVVFRLITEKSSYRIFPVFRTPLTMALGMYASFNQA